MDNKYAIKYDDRLRSENHRLRKRIEELEADAGIPKLKKEHDATLAKARNKYEKLEKEKEKYHVLWRDKVRECDHLRMDCAIFEDTIKEQQAKLDEKDARIEELEGILQKMKAQMNRDYENSSIPSSQCANRKKITNSREKTGRKPGGQPGHEGHHRRKVEATENIDVAAPPEVDGNPDYYKTNDVVTKQLIEIRLELVVKEYKADVYRNRITGGRVHGVFPEGLVNEVTYGDSVKALAAMLNNYCNVSMDKVSEFIYDLTDGQLKLSKGLIASLAGEFNAKSKGRQDEIYSGIVNSPVMNVDLTNVRENGKQQYVIVTASGKNVLFFAREHRGHEAVKGTPVEEYIHTLVHDHDLTFYNYGDSHQECLSHALRYLQDSIENEAGITWNISMKKFLQETIHWYKGFEDPLSGRDISTIRENYSVILSLAESEYAQNPPTKYYREGINLSLRMRKYKDEHLLFLTDRSIPYTNNFAERLLRQIKRKVRQMGCFRSFDGIANYCAVESVIETAKLHNLGIYSTLREVFAGTLISGSS